MIYVIIHLFILVQAQTVAKKKDELIRQCEDLEKDLAQREDKLEELRAKFCLDDDSTLRGDSVFE